MDKTAQRGRETLMHGANTMFILMGAIMGLALHAGIPAFLRWVTVRPEKPGQCPVERSFSDFAKFKAWLLLLLSVTGLLMA